MGRVAVRAAVTSYLQGANLSYVGTVYSGRPTIIAEEDYTLNAEPSESGSSCVIVVNFTDDQRQRRADTGRGAVNDSVQHTVKLELFFGSRKGDAIAAQNDYDLIVDQLFDVIRANAVMNAPGVIWSSGENSPWIRHEQIAPYWGPGGTTACIKGVVEFEAIEWVAGPVVAYPLA